MYTNKKIGDNAILVTDNSKSNKMYVREAGSANKYSEMELLSVEDGKIVINGDVAARFGLSLEVTGERPLSMGFSSEDIERT